MRHYLVRDVMTADATTVTPATPLKDVADILVRGRIGVVPVLTPQGRVTASSPRATCCGRSGSSGTREKARHSMHLPYRVRRDIATCRDRGRAHGPLPGERGPADTSVAEAARLMDRHQSRFLLVTGEDGKLLGVVTARDLLRVFLRPDEDIKAEIVSALGP